jgi:hypothetical protein
MSDQPNPKSPVLIAAFEGWNAPNTQIRPAAGVAP